MGYPYFWKHPPSHSWSPKKNHEKTTRTSRFQACDELGCEPGYRVEKTSSWSLPGIYSISCPPKKQGGKICFFLHLEFFRWNPWDLKPGQWPRWLIDFFWFHFFVRCKERDIQTSKNSKAFWGMGFLMSKSFILPIDSKKIRCEAAACFRVRYTCKPCQVPECQVCTKDKMICALEGKNIWKKGQTRVKNLGGQETLVDWSNGFRFVKSSVLQSKEGKRKANTLHLSVRHLNFFSTPFPVYTGISLVSHTFNERGPNRSIYVQHISAFQQTRGLSTICWKIFVFSFPILLELILVPLRPVGEECGKDGSAGGAVKVILGFVIS